ncbi:nuclear transport factor 2 family protein [Stenotrophomonas sp.]|uniref:nuclear transport factor 2 family protein n=1 Tax=Stenotrophomonas sp. TaxID=69392 RepID=UPI0028ABE062|nr:nuclear transport factor 2 family protein [Stenotrophomonas sp.]
MIAADHKSILEQANAAVRVGDNEGFLAHCTDDIRWTTVGEGTLQGKQAVRDWMKTAYASPPSFRVEKLVAEGDMVVALGTIMADDAQGQPAEFAYSDVWRFRDGKLAELDAFVIQPKG